MGRSAVLQGLQEKAEFFRRFFLADAEQVEVEVEGLRRELEDLRAQFAEFRSQFE